MKTLSLAEIVREDFPIFHKHPSLIYFDNAATTQKPQIVLDTMMHFLSSEYGTVHRAVYQLAASATEKYNQVREKVAHFLHAAHAEEIIFTRGTTDAINLVARSFGASHMQAGDEIIISEMEHHSNIVPWQMLCREKGTILKIIPINSHAELDLQAYKRLLTPRTKIVSIAHIANSTGTLNPIKEIISLAHQRGAKVFIDGAQSAGHCPVDVQDLDADFFAFSGHKVYGPTGIGILYGKKEILETLPPVQGGGDMIEKVTLQETIFQPPPLRFEAGTPSIGEVIGLGAAIDYLNNLGLETIAKWEEQLTVYATEKLLQIPGLKIIGTAKNKGPIISFIVDKVHHLDLATMLDLQDIAIRSGHHCAQPLLQHFGLTGTCRISFGIFNTFEEIDRCIEALKKIIPQLKRTS